MSKLKGSLGRTIEKYFLSKDGTISLTVVGVAIFLVAATIASIKELWPLEMADIMQIAKNIGVAAGAVGIRGAFNDKAKPETEKEEI